MSFVEVIFCCPIEVSESISDLALVSGALAAGIRPLADVFEDNWQASYPDDRVEVCLLFEQQGHWQEQLAWIFKTHHQTFPYTTRTFADEDWIAKTRSSFEPMTVGPFGVTPSWHAPASGTIPIVIDPGQAFGTGTHPTTRLCLIWLGTLNLEHQSCLDYGTGSGILAIAAAKRGACPVYGVDVDPLAIRVARENSAANGVHVNCFLPAELPDLQADVIVANILARPLLDLAPYFHRIGHEGARIALSGILERQAGMVKTGYADYFDLQVTAVDDGWVLLTGERLG